MSYVAVLTGGDCKTSMFVHISPNVADLGETFCSLNFASQSVSEV